MCGFQLLQEDMMKVHNIQHELKMAQSKSASFSKLSDQTSIKLKSYTDCLII